MGLRLVARGLSAETRGPERLRIAAEAAPPRDSRPASRRAYFGPPHDWLETPLVARQDLAGGPSDGPLILEEYDATTVIPPGCRASLDTWGNLRIERLE
jgi:N-methylhydantoinase A